MPVIPIEADRVFYEVHCNNNVYCYTICFDDAILIARENGMEYRNAKCYHAEIPTYSWSIEEVEPPGNCCFI